MRSALDHASTRPAVPPAPVGQPHRLGKWQRCGAVSSADQTATRRVHAPTPECLTATGRGAEPTKETTDAAPPKDPHQDRHRERRQSQGRAHRRRPPPSRRLTVRSVLASGPSREYPPLPSGRRSPGKWSKGRVQTGPPSAVPPRGARSCGSRSSSRPNLNTSKGTPMHKRLPLPPGAIPITPAQLAVLLAAADGRPHTQVDIAKRIGRTKAPVHGHVHALRKKGLLVDAPFDTHGAVATDLVEVGFQPRIDGE